jgi:fermentation-respiration switch protein FrsA (DUF1100 family)
MAITLSLLVAATAVSVGASETREVQFESKGERLAGRVFLPAGYRSGRLPSVVVTGAWFTIKEQMPTTYAREFARLGYAALVFDFRGFGKSEGAPRNTENPDKKDEDIVSAARFFAKQPYVDARRLVGMSMCASTGYMANAILQGAPMNAMASAALWVQDPATVLQVYGGQTAVDNLLREADRSEKAFRETGDPISVPAAGDPGTDAVMQQAPYYNDTARGRIPEWDNLFSLMSWRYWLSFDSLKPAKNLTVPTLVMHSDRAALPDMARRFYADLPGPKAIYWSGEAHMDFYDNPTAVRRSVGLAADFFGRHVARRQTDSEMIEETLQQIAASVDAKAWDGVRQRMAENLQVDYSSLGGAKGPVRADELVSGWREFHAKFAEMRHVYTNFTVSVQGDTAIANHQGIASLMHKQGETEKRWTVGGDYEATLAKQNGKWLVTGLKFTARFQHGDRD